MTHEKNNVMKISIIFLLLAHLTAALTVPVDGRVGTRVGTQRRRLVLIYRCVFTFSRGLITR